MKNKKQKQTPYLCELECSDAQRPNIYTISVRTLVRQRDDLRGNPIGWAYKQINT